MKLTINKIKSDSYEIGYKCWHINDKFKYITDKRTYSVNVCDSFTGCGLVIMHGWCSGGLNRKVAGKDISEINVKTFLKKVIKSIKERGANENGVGAIQCTVGNQFYDDVFEKALIDTGFKCILEFSNYRHGEDGKYTQRIYTITL